LPTSASLLEIPEPAMEVENKSIVTRTACQCTSQCAVLAAKTDRLMALAQKCSEKSELTHPNASKMSESSDFFKTAWV
jgi:hypothetical protein